MQSRGFKGLFGDGRFIIIPHYKKKPAVPECDLVALGDVVTALEVSSEKKWSHEYARVDKPVVLFSDYRCKSGASGAFGKCTYAAIGDLSFESLRLAFNDKAKFSITGKEAHMELEPNLYASMGLNVVIGGRSSGKTFFLDRINDSCDPDDVVYVRQFDIVKDAGEKTFREKLLDEEAAIKSDYYEPMEAISSTALKLPSRDAVTKEIKDYLAGLEAFAVTSAREDEFSKCPIYSEGRIAMKSAEPEKKIVEAIMALLADNPLEKEIEEVVGRDKLLELLRISMSRYKDKALECRLIDEANKIAQAVRGKLSIESSRPECPMSPMVGAAKRSVYVNRLAKLRELTKGETVVSSKAIGKFRRVVKRIPYKNASVFKAAIATSSNMAGVLQKPDEAFVEDLLAAKGVSDVSRAFFDMVVTLENERGEEVSGGQRAEYLFFRALERAASHDVVLIDEPESSFDNMFLNDLIAGTLKEISKKSTVFIATHNNVLGVSIKPDGIVYADVEDGVHRIFTCDSGDELMRSSDGSTVKRSEVLLRFMEAGGRAYKDRRPYYGLA